jgi:predicted metal-binding protein
MSNEIRSRPTPWKTIVLVCGKCSRKLDGGFGPNGDDSLRAAVRAELKQTGRRRDVRIIETRCIGICPKHAVTAIDPARPNTIYVIPAGTPAGLALARLAPQAG